MRYKGVTQRSLIELLKPVTKEKQKPQNIQYPIC
jgi:hypothetical protein